jgi:hypothetical protein
MKIKSGILGTRQIVDSKEDRERIVRSKGASGSGSSDVSGVQISSDSALVQSFREAARGQEPVSAELVEQAKLDLSKGLLGSEEDIEQAITALLQEL